MGENGYHNGNKKTIQEVVSHPLKMVQYFMIIVPTLFLHLGILQKIGELAICHLDEQKMNIELRNNYFLR